MRDPTANPIFSHPTLPEERHYNGLTFPLTVSPPPHRPDLLASASTSHSYLREHRSTLESLLQKHSVLLLRSFGQKTAQDFATLVEDSLGLPNFPYVGGNAVRTPVVGDRVFTTNESPPDKQIPFHHELAQTSKFPRRLLFFCEKPGDSGGETPVLYSPAVYEDLKNVVPEFMDKLEKEGVRYSRVMTKEDRPHSAIGRGWKKTFGVQTKEEVERVLRERGYEWEWIGEGEDCKLRETSPVLRAVHVGEDGRKSFFNQLFAVWGGWRDEFNEPQKCVMAGDGSLLDVQAMELVGEVMAKHRVAVPWEQGDVLYIDNMMAQHSRAPFTGRRRVLASLACENVE